MLREYSLRVAVLFVLVLAAAFITQLPSAGESKQLAAADELVRLHVLAHNDDEHEQLLKHRVKEALLSVLADRLPQDGGAEATLEFFRSNEALLLEVAERALREAGSDHPVRMEVGVHWYPEKATGGIIVPAGYYDSVRVIIGKGEGKNWWCVLFPRLCLATGEVSEEELKAFVLEAGLVDEEELEEVRYEIRFKLLTWLTGKWQMVTR